MKKNYKDCGNDALGFFYVTVLTVLMYIGLALVFVVHNTIRHIPIIGPIIIAAMLVAAWYALMQFYN